MAQRVVYRQFRFERPHRVRRTPQDSAAVWRARLPRFLLMTGCWAVAALSWLASDGATATVTIVTAAAFVLNLAVCVKALVLIRRDGRGSTARARPVRSGDQRG
jgi:hypothetical protein